MDGQTRLLRCEIKEIRSVKEFLEHFNIERDILSCGVNQGIFRINLN